MISDTVKKVSDFPVPSRDVTSLVSDIPAGDEKIVNLFYIGEYDYLNNKKIILSPFVLITVF